MKFMSQDLEISSWHHFEECLSLSQKLDLLADKICMRLEPLLTSKNKSHRRRRLFQPSLEDSSRKIEMKILEALSSGEKSKETLYAFFKRNVKANELNTALENLIEDGRIQMEKRSAAGRGKRPKMVFRTLQ